eukprot:SAG31_NODE_255_length_19039_cov_83.461774_10_plen_94_part_00
MHVVLPTVPDGAVTADTHTAYIESSRECTIAVLAARLRAHHLVTVQQIQHLAVDRWPVVHVSLICAFDFCRWKVQLWTCIFSAGTLLFQYHYA